MNSGSKEKINLAVFFKSLVIGSVALGALLLFTPFIASAAILAASVLEAWIDIKSFAPISSKSINLLFPITSVALIMLALLPRDLSHALALFSLSVILAGFRAWGYVGFRSKTLMISGSTITVFGCLGLLLTIPSATSSEGIFTSLDIGRVIYGLILSAPWSTLVLSGLIIYSSTMIYMLKYIPSETSASSSQG